MSSVVSITDRDDWERTDAVVVVDPKRRRLLWIPRDLWSQVVGDRVNRAFALGGHELLIDALAEFGLKVSASICVRRTAVTRVLEGVRLTVPVSRQLRFWYPLHPLESLEDGRKLIVFAPPQELLEGERIHQWLGARAAVDPVPGVLPDLARIERQQVFVRRLLEDGFRFAELLEDPTFVSVSGGTRALADLALVEPSWRLRTFDAVRPATIEGKEVLVPDRPARIRHLRRLVRHVAGG
jgi:hypothetical protein